MRSDLTDIEVMIHYDTEKAVFVSTDGLRSSAVWLAKSLVEFEEPIRFGKAQIITLPQRLAEEKGLV